MRRPRSACILIVAGLAAIPFINAVPTTPAIAAPAPRDAPTLTGILEFRTFIQDCKCYPWAIDKSGKTWEVDVSRVQSDADALIGQRVKATGRWSTYQRDGQTIRYFRVTRLDPA